MQAVVLKLKLHKISNQLKNYTNQLLVNLKKEKYIHHLKTIFGVDNLADMQLICKFYKRIRFLLCVIDIYSKCAWVVPLKDKKVITIVNAFQKILDDSKRKPNKIWVDKGSEFYNRSMKSCLEKMIQGCIQHIMKENLLLLKDLLEL